MPVPIAIIVCEGDIDTIAHIAGTLQNKLPVIVMKGSGKAANLIVDYLEKYRSQIIEYQYFSFLPKFDKKIKLQKHSNS